MLGYAHILQRIAEQVGCPPLKQVAARPGTRAVYRVTTHFPDMRAGDVVATLVYSGGREATLSTVYQGRFNHKPLTRQLDSASYEVIAQTFRPALFDRLTDQPNIAFYSVSLCLLERGAGSFVKGVIASPSAATGVYAQLLDIVRVYLPEALREIK